MTTIGPRLVAGLVLATFFETIDAQIPADAEIRSHIETSLLVDPRIAAANVDVGVADGFVTLRGRVGSLAGHEFAIREAEKIAGVKGVTDELVVAAPWRPDADIVQDVRDRLVDHCRISSNGLRVRCEQGEVTLDGEVPAVVERELASDLATEVRGVRKVTNAILVTGDWTRGDSDIQRDVADALALDVYLTGLPVTADVENGTVVLRGAVGSPYVRRRAEAAVRRLPGVRGVKDDLEVRWSANEGERRGVPAVDAATLAQRVRHQLGHDSRIDASALEVSPRGDEIKLWGTVPSAFERRLAVADAQDTLGVASVDDEVRIRAAARADDAIRADVLRELGSDSELWDTAVDVRSKAGVVTLGGKVETRFQRRHADEIAHRILGVTRVVDDLEVASPASANATLAREVGRRLHWDWRTHRVDRDIAVTVSDGSVTLRGDVGTWSQRQAAGVIANETPGVWRVFNDIRVDGHPCPSNDRRELPVPTGGPGG